MAGYVPKYILQLTITAINIQRITRLFYTSSVHLASILEFQNPLNVQHSVELFLEEAESVSIWLSLWKLAIRASVNYTSKLIDRKSRKLLEYLICSTSDAATKAKIIISFLRNLHSTVLKIWQLCLLAFSDEGDSVLCMHFMKFSLRLCAYAQAWIDRQFRGSR